MTPNIHKRAMQVAAFIGVLLICFGVITLFIGAGYSLLSGKNRVVLPPARPWFTRDVLVNNSRSATPQWRRCGIQVSKSMYLFVDPPNNVIVLMPLTLGLDRIFGEQATNNAAVPLSVKVQSESGLAATFRISQDTLVIVTSSKTQRLEQSAVAIYEIDDHELAKGLSIIIDQVAAGDMEAPWSADASAWVLSQNSISANAGLRGMQWRLDPQEDSIPAQGHVPK